MGHNVRLFGPQCLLNASKTTVDILGEKFQHKGIFMRDYRNFGIKTSAHSSELMVLGGLAICERAKQSKACCDHV